MNSEHSTVSHVYRDNGEYDVELTVTDDDGAAVTQTLEVVVDNVAPAIAELTGDTEINEGDTATFTAEASDPGNDELTYTWNLEDGTTISGTEVTISKTLVEDGDYDVHLTVSDEDGATATRTVTVKVNNLPPIIEEQADRTANEGTPMAFSANFSDPGILDTHTIEWDFGDDSSVSDTLTPTHTYTDNGKYDVTLTVTDDEGASTSNTFQVTVDNVAPAISFAGARSAIAKLTGDTEINEGETANFSALATDASGDELTYTWNFGDGSDAVTGQDATHIFKKNGNYGMELTVTDDDGATVTETLEVVVNNVAPTIIELTGDTEINEGDTATFGAVSTDPGAGELTYTWDFGDGSQVSGTEVMITQRFVEDGDYDLNLTVSDEDGAIASRTVTIKVNNVAPIVEEQGDRTANEGAPVAFNASFSDPGIADTHTLAWDFGDGSTKSDTLTPTHVYRDNGEYDVSLTVTDDEGASTSSSFKVTVNNVAPTITSFTGDRTIDEGDTANFSAEATDPGDDQLTYTWDFGDNTTPVNGQNPSHQYLQDGTYDASLTVTDDDGATTSQTIGITVNNLPPTVEAGVNQTVYIGETVNFQGTFADSGSLDTHTLEWSFADGRGLGGPPHERPVQEGDNTDTTGTNQPSHTYTTEGVYNVTYHVRDDKGASSSDTLQLTVKKLPTLAVNDLTIVEGDSGTANALFTVSLNEACTRPVKVNYTTANATATAGTDYTAATGTLTFAPGQTTQTVTVAVTGDRLDEIDETFSLNLTDPVNAAIALRAPAKLIADNSGLATITDNDPVPSLTINDQTITEGDSGTNNLTFTVTLSEASAKADVEHAPYDGAFPSAKIVTVNYNTANGTVTFNPGQTSQTVTIAVTGDRITENNETVLLNLTNPVNAAIADPQGIGTIIDNDLNSYSIKAEGQVFINGSSDFDGVANNPNDDVKIYAGKGFTFNGNIALAVKLDAAGNPILSNGKPVLVDRAVAVAPGYLSSTANAAKNQYANLLPPQVIEAQTINVPVYADLVTQESTRRIPTGTPTVTFNAATNPLNTLADWTAKFPSAGTTTRPTVVKVTGGGLNIPSNANLNHYVIVVESGDLNFNGSNHNLNNVMLKTNNGNVNLANVTAKDLSLFASGSINTNSGARFAGQTLLATGTSNGNITFNGATSTVDANSTLRVIANGDLTYNGASATRGELITAKNFSFNGSSSLYGAIAAKGNITFNGSATVIGIPGFTTTP